MGFFGGGSGSSSSASKQQPPEINVPVAVPVNDDDPEAGYRQQQQYQEPPLVPQQQMPLPIYKTTNTASYGTATTSTTMEGYANNGMGGLEFTTRLPTIIPTCPNCTATNVRTVTRTFPSLTTWLAVLVMLIVFWPLCWLPLVVDQCRHTTHICTNCHQPVGEIPAFADCCVTQRGS